MTDEGLANVVTVNSAAVIGYAYIRYSAPLYLYRKSRSSGVNGVFHKFLDNRGRTFNDLARSY